ncbi:MAG: metallophosphoesterase [Vicinamibacterales bacterium]
MNRFLKPLAFGLTFASVVGLTLTGVATADDHKSDLRVGGNGPLTIAVYGDAPYSNVPADFSQTPPNETSEFDATPAFIDAVNKDKKVKLVLFAGDIHSGKQPCTAAYDRSIASLWTAFRDPLVYAPGDNEWADCHKSGQGGNVQYPPASGNYVDYANGDPVANLGLIRQLFFANPGDVLGGGHMRVLSQAQAFDASHPSDAEYVENVMWEQSGVLFVSVNIPGGSNNDADPWYGAAETGEQAQERTQRTAADLRWLDAAFAQATTDHVGAVTILTQADMWDLDHKAASHIVGYEPFIGNIATNTAEFGKPVLLMNGDSHTFRSDDPLVDNAPCVTEGGACTDGTTLADAYDTHATFNSANSINVPNFHRIVVHGSTFPFEYLRLSIDTKHAPAAGPNSFGPFSWERVQP